VDTAIEMQRRFSALVGEFPDMASLGLSVGLHSGEAIVGNIGSEKLMDYTVVGDTVNVAKRLQEQALGGQVVISRATYEQVRGIKAKRLKPLQLFGREEPIEAFLIGI
jgi:adenylate cyclase